MKKSILAIALSVFALTSTSALAQTEAGHCFAKANTGLNFAATVFTKAGNQTVKKNLPTEFNLAVDGGYFVVDNLALGACVELKHEGQAGNSALAYVVAPKVTYFLPLESEIKPYANLYVGYAGVNGTVKANDVKVSTNKGGLAFGAGLGAAYFLQSNVAVSCELGYQQTSMKLDKVTSTVGRIVPTIGFSLFF